jgi:hypothetical protein
MPKPPPLNLMVASSVYNYEDQLRQICGVLTGYGYNVWNSHIGTLPVHPGLSNAETCIKAAKDCDVFLGIIRGHYGTSDAGTGRSVTHEEVRTAVNLDKPRWILAHQNVTIARQLLKPYLLKRDGSQTKFKLKKNPILSDLRVFELYDDATQAGVIQPRWVQSYTTQDDALAYINSQFKNLKRVRKICAEMNAP